LSVPALIGFTAVALVVIGWLVVSFTAPGRRRTAIEWTAATCLYVALLSLFVNLLLRARADDSLVGLIAFGFLCVMFGGGLVVSAFQTVQSVRSDKSANASTTN
jgi:hypothetical protein